MCKSSRCILEINFIHGAVRLCVPLWKHIKYSLSLQWMLNACKGMWPWYPVKLHNLQLLFLVTVLISLHGELDFWHQKESSPTHITETCGSASQPSSVEHNRVDSPTYGFCLFIICKLVGQWIVKTCFLCGVACPSLARSATCLCACH